MRYSLYKFPIYKSSSTKKTFILYKFSKKKTNAIYEMNSNLLVKNLHNLKTNWELIKTSLAKWSKNQQYNHFLLTIQIAGLAIVWGPFEPLITLRLRHVSEVVKVERTWSRHQPSSWESSLRMWERKKRTEHPSCAAV